jgi:hypothetical protein
MDRWDVGARPASACSRCCHSAQSHIHGDPLACAFCALTPLAHTVAGCSLYTPRTVPRSGASCRVPGCECIGGYSAASAKPTGTADHELLGGNGRQ